VFKPAIVTTNEMMRTLFVRSKNQIGTAFVMLTDDVPHIVTAAHIFENQKQVEMAEVHHQGQWKRLEYSKYLENKEEDFLVFPQEKPSDKWTDRPKCSADGIMYGQDVCFFGYPFGMRGEGEILDGLPMPFVKRGALAGFAPAPNGHRFYLDAIANPGFSGGPAFFHNFQTDKTHAFGIIIGSVTKDVPIKLKTKQSETAVVAMETGLVMGVTLDFVDKFIRSHA
jgi:hypothetical protein